MNILFVCTGNTCRSPMAEAILAARDIAGIEARSAGIYAMDGGEISRNALMVLEKARIHSNHVSSSLNEQMLEWADVVLTMTASHKQLIIHAFPEIATKVSMYKEFATPLDIQDVSDPYGGDLHTYEKTFQELHALTDELVKKLQEDIE